MAFGQTNTGFQVGINNSPFSTGFSTGFSASKPTNTATKNDTTTYNPRYPGFNEEDYKKLEKMVADKGVTGSKKTEIMDELYQIYYPQVLNQHKLDERQVEINKSVYQNGEALLNGNKEVTMGTKLTTLAQDAKKKFNIPYDTPDDVVLDYMVKGIPNGNQLLYDYANGKNNDIYYEAGIKTKVVEDKPQNTVQGGIKGRIADAGGNAEEGSIFPDKWELVNPIGYITEVIDEGAKKVADKITIGKKARENLINEINNLSDEDLQQYKRWYEDSGYNGSFEDYVIDMNKTWWQDMVGADEELKGIAEPNVFKFFGNLPASTLRLVTASLRNATNPFDVAKGLWQIVSTPEGRQALKDRYLTAEGWANAMNYDAMGTADEILSVTNSIGGLAKGFGKVTGVKGIENFGNNLSKVGSPFDVVVDRALKGGDITYGTPDNVKTTNVKGLYGTMDDIAGDSKVLGAVNRYVQDTSSVGKLLENAGEDIKAVKQKANTWADEIIQNNNRMTKKQQTTFKEMIGEDQGKWMNDRNLRTQEDLVNYFLESKNKVDDAMASIEGQFTSKELTAVLDDSLDFAQKTENPNVNRLQELQTKNANGGLTMSEINEVKRFYEKNNKFNYLKEGTAEKSALATNRDTALREWQQKVAADNGLTNLKELNKETQAAKYLSDNATNWQSGVKGNNPISLTDWIVASGGGFDINGIKNVVGKKIFSSPRFQDKLVDVLNYIGGHEVKDAINPDMKAISDMNTQKKQTAELKAYEKRILAEELAKIKNEEDFNKWLQQAEYMAGPALPYNPRYDGQAPIDYSTPTVVTPGGQSIRPGQIAEI